MGHLCVVTGERGAGKTTFCARVAGLARQRGWRVRGILSLAVVDAGMKVAIAAEALEDGERRLLARPRQGAVGSGPSTPGWQFDSECLSWGNGVLEASVPCDLLVVDELGPLELERGEGWVAGLSSLDSGLYRLGLAVIRPALLPRARARWPAAQIISIEPAADSQALARALADACLADAAGPMLKGTG
jgi:nucleoside-triphosphatase